MPTTPFTFYIGSFAFCISPYLLCLDSLPLWGGAERRRGLIQTPPPSQGLGDPSLSKEGSICGYGCAFEVQPTPSALRAATPPFLGRGALGMELFLNPVT